MNYDVVSQQILEKVGGEKNIKNVTHCYTRLRFTLVDDTKADAKGIESMDEVLNVVNSSGQFQVVIGSEVANVYKALKNILGDNEVKEEAPKQKRTVKSTLNGMLDVLISSFTPLIPMIAGSGMIKVLCALLLNFNVLTDASSTYQILAFIGDAVFYFLPIMVGYTSAKKLNADPFLGMVIGAILIHPNFSAMAVDGVTHVNFLEMPVRIINYSAQALPIIITVWVAKYIDNFFDKICPNIVKVFLKPMLTLLVVAPIMLIVIAPLGAIMGDYFQGFCNIMNQWGWIAVGLNAAIFPFLVLTGMHNALIPLMITMFATQGFDAVLIPSGLAANIAEGAAAFGVGLRTKDKGIRGTAFAATVSALFGVTEPALYGINLRFKKPFIAMLLGSLIGGCFAGLFGVIAYSFVSPSIVSLPIFAGGNGNSFIMAIATVIFTFIVTAVIAYVMGIDNSEENDLSEIKSPVEGQMVALKDVNDAAFSTESMGKGFAVKPTSGKVVAPFDGEIVALFPTKHAIGIKRVDGLELLIHIGLDTVNLNGEGFTTFVEVGSHVKAGETIVEFDKDAIEAKGYDTVTVVVVTNTSNFKKVEAQNKINVALNEGVLNVQ